MSQFEVMQQAIDVSRTESEEGGRLLVISAGSSEGFFKQIAFGGIENFLIVSRRHLAASAFEELCRKIFGDQHIRGTEDDRALDDVLKLPDISRPVIARSIFSASRDMPRTCRPVSLQHCFMKCRAKTGMSSALSRRAGVLMVSTFKR